MPIGSTVSSPGSAGTSERLLDEAVGVMHDTGGMSPVLVVIAAVIELVIDHSESENAFQVHHLHAHCDAASILHSR